MRKRAWSMRYRLAVRLFDLAARIYPAPGRGVSQSHHVGERWFRWEIREKA